MTNEAEVKQLIELANSTRSKKIELMIRLEALGYKPIVVDGADYYIHPDYLHAAKDNATSTEAFLAWSLDQPREAVFYV